MKIDWTNTSKICMWVQYDETYMVSDDGQVMNSLSGRILAGALDKDGYRTFNINQKTMKLHRLVGLCFLPRIDLPTLEIDHINRDRSDNRASNLRWCDRYVNKQNNSCKHISFYDGKYIVRFHRYHTKVYHKRFNTLEEAIIGRDEFLATL